MHKKPKKTKTEQPPKTAVSQHRMDSHHWRKIILLFLIAGAIFFDLMILGMGQLIEKETANISQIKLPEEKPWEENIRSLVKGYPIEKMVPYINRRNEKTAAFLVSVAKKESDWGNHVPVLNGKDCYNYWGFRARSDRMTWDGYTCFENPREAVNTVGRRFNELVQKEGLNTPREMAVWKCGYDCSWDSLPAVEKWISDVDYYYNKIVTE